MATCPTCSGEFTPLPNHHPVQRYCRRECKERARARIRQAAVKAERAAARAARTALKAERRSPLPRLCLECDAPISNSRARLCSDLCKQGRKLRMDREYNATRPGRRPRPPGCESCGGPCPPSPRKKCDGCVHKAERRRLPPRLRRRRALKLGVPSEPYTLAEIAQRDRYRCGLCRKRVAMTQAVPHPKAPTIDHVVPMADGGDDTRANVQLAHFLCNSLKCTQGTQQLMLIG
jgi:hypothetical protein